MKLLIDNINNYNDNDFLDFYQQLNINDNNKIDKIIKVDDKKRSILGRHLLSKILKNSYNINYNDCDIYYNNNNKPFINNIYFNISHSEDLVAVVVSNNKIGIDIEQIKNIKINIINHFCTQNEINYILNSKETIISIFKLFCLKEAYLKMKGSSILKAREIEFNIDNNKIKCLIDNNININLKNINDKYIIAIVEEKNKQFF